MVKRRNSPYASHDPNRLPGMRPNFAPALLDPMPLTARKKFAVMTL
jgi:hypothetical protein